MFPEGDRKAPVPVYTTGATIGGAATVTVTGGGAVTVTVTGGLGADTGAGTGAGMEAAVVAELSDAARNAVEPAVAEHPASVTVASARTPTAITCGRRCCEFFVMSARVRGRSWRILNGFQGKV
jgi:hypothetical protein